MGVRTHVARRELAKARKQRVRMSEILDARDDFERSRLGRECRTTNLYKLIANRADRFVPERA